ncbi:uncharacterized protein TRIVIDRAFT_232455 [Trichoderma virens Gv29-8]|uniref:Uncharacterized protein n=1 Tax=Hypocrea virens (strain Gv29-8 / FGSC 10586) TaxID=413071 RepID=G9NB10_HYPVG|nr:uncharacterized protein TRIVIDRAFT_232455 [Trichoderma virens Gv29-8]EHK16020.1 hypothetical protein TRIVIDRAFT_232455 [Trichoderma virens Gv29-8]UKZ56208.1 hypothetical protein TrVGV298_010039 [Trichoderma virens]
MSIVRARGMNPAAAGAITRDAESYSMGPRINLRRSLESIGSLLRRSDCVATEAANTCEKPVGPSDSTLAIVLGIIIPVCVAVVVLFFLHRRNMRRDKLEELNDPTKDLDFGMGNGPTKKRKSLLGLGGEKPMHKGGLSMDMNLSSPYLLPPGNHGSRESIHSYARTLQTEDDPYRTVNQYAASDVGSIRSFNPNDNSGARPPKSSGLSKPPMQTNPSTPRAPSPDEKVDPFATPTAPKPTHQPPSSAEVHDVMLPVQPIVPEIETVPPVDVFNADEFEVPDIPAPAPAALKIGQDGSRSPAHFEQPNSARSSAYTDNGMASPAHPADRNVPQILSPGLPPHEDAQEESRGRPLSRPPPPHQAGGLGVPQNNSKRLSVGFRPLPPSEAMESDDPEIRANRIRSFYKEYFDDSNEVPPPLPTQPQQHQQQQPNQRQQGGPDYYEDYDQGYLEAAAYYDADTNAFVMPYAQPVTRRAMTPPPSGRQGGPMGGPRGPGPRGPGFRGPNGNGGTFSPGPGRPRAGSAFGRPRAGSAFGPRPDSSASGAWARQQQPKKNLPPPAPLNTLPTPSKLGDDSFAIFNAADFAPPSSIRDNVAGRSQSPFGERKAFLQPPTAGSQLAGAFDELAALPSPHLLRKSGTFTALDFAPPKKFRDPENASDAGSIRSNKSGMSQAHLQAIRSGAGRVSRLPGDTVFTTAAMDDQLKPSWTLRP